MQQPQPDRAELQQAVRRLTRTVDHLLDATRLESGLLQPRREWCEPGELVREAVAMSGLKESAVRVNIAKNLPTISVDAHLIQQALGALLSNAAGHARNDQPIEVNAARDDSMLVISVADHGPGLAPGEENKSLSKNFIAVPAPHPAVSALAFPSRANWSRRTAGRSSRKIEKKAAHDFSIRLPIGEPMRLPSKRPHETGRIDRR